MRLGLWLEGDKVKTVRMRPQEGREDLTECRLHKAPGLLLRGCCPPTLRFAFCFLGRKPSEKIGSKYSFQKAIHLM